MDIDRALADLRVLDLLQYEAGSSSTNPSTIARVAYQAQKPASGQSARHPKLT